MASRYFSGLFVLAAALATVSRISVAETPLPSEKAAVQSFIQAASKDNAAGIRSLVDRDSRYWNSGVLETAIAQNREDIAKILIAHHVNVNARPPLQDFPHASGVKQMASPLESAVLGGEVKIAKILLKAGAKPGAALADAVSNPKASISARDREAMVLLLLRHGANPNSESGGLTALDWASANGYTRIVKILLKRGADVDATKGKPANALKVARANGHWDIARLLEAARKSKKSVKKGPRP